MAWEDGWSTFVFCFLGKAKKKGMHKGCPPADWRSGREGDGAAERCIKDQREGKFLPLLDWLRDVHALKRLQRVCLSARNGEESVLTKIKRMSLPGEAFILSWPSLISTSPFQSPKCKVWRSYSRLPNGLIRKQLRTSDLYSSIARHRPLEEIPLDKLVFGCFFFFYAELHKRGRKWCNASLYRYAESKEKKTTESFHQLCDCVLTPPRLCHASCSFAVVITPGCPMWWMWLWMGGCDKHYKDDWLQSSWICKYRLCGFVFAFFFFLTFLSCLHRFSDSVTSVSCCFSRKEKGHKEFSSLPIGLCCHKGRPKLSLWQWITSTILSPCLRSLYYWKV